MQNQLERVRMKEDKRLLLNGDERQEKLGLTGVGEYGGKWMN